MAVLGEIGLRLGTLFNARNLILTAFLAFFAATTLLYPYYHTYQPLRAALTPMAHQFVNQTELVDHIHRQIASSYGDSIKAMEVQIAALRQEGATVKQKIASKYDEQLRKEKDKFAAAIQTMQTQWEEAQERGALQQAVGEAEREAQLDALLQRFVLLKQKSDDLHVQVLQQAERHVQQLQTVREEAAASCHARTQEQAQVIEEEFNVKAADLVSRCQEVQDKLEEVLAAKEALQRSTVEVSQRGHADMTKLAASCQEQLETQKDILSSHFNETYLQHVTQAMETYHAAHPVTCPPCQHTPQACQEVCVEEIARVSLGAARRMTVPMPSYEQAEAAKHHYAVDYALHSSGALVLNNMTSATYFPPQMHLSSIVKQSMSSMGLQGAAEYVPEVTGEQLMDGLGLRLGRGRPEDALTEDLSLGACWPMAGHRGNLTVRLLHPVTLTAISIDHVAKSTAWDYSTAPRAFSLFTSSGAPEDLQDVLDGSFDWMDDLTVQHYPLQQPVEQVSLLTLAIHSNHGHSDYTCLYRLRVHGFVPH